MKLPDLINDPNTEFPSFLNIDTFIKISIYNDGVTFFLLDNYFHTTPLNDHQVIDSNIFRRHDTQPVGVTIS